MRNIYLSLFILFFLPNITHGQSKILLEEKNGVLYLPCKINGILLDYLFDTGASVVTINDSIYRLMLSNGLITIDDSIGKEKYQDASGNVQDFITFNIKSIELGGIVLENIKGGVVPNNNKSFLFGQSALKCIGKYNLDTENKILELKNDSLISASIYKRSNSYDFILNNITKEIMHLNSYYISNFNYDKSIRQPIAKYRELDSIINSEDYLNDNSKDTSNLILAYSYLGLFYINSGVAFKVDKGRSYMRKFIENESFLRYVSTGDQCVLILDSSYYNSDGKRNNKALREGDSSYYYENKITKEKFYEFPDDDPLEHDHYFNHDWKFTNCEIAIQSALTGIVSDYFASANYAECIKSGVKAQSILKRYFKPLRAQLSILFDIAQAKINLGDFNGALHDIDTLFAYSKIICNRDSLRYKLILHRKCEPDDAFYILKGLCFFNLKKYSEAITQFDKYFNKANTKLKENNEEDIENMSKAYYFRGLSKIALKNKQSGCDDLSKSGELGYSQAYEAIQDKCN